MFMSTHPEEQAELEGINNNDGLQGAYIIRFGMKAQE